METKLFALNYCTFYYKRDFLFAYSPNYDLSIKSLSLHNLSFLVKLVVLAVGMIAWTLGWDLGRESLVDRSAGTLVIYGSFNDDFAMP